MTYVFKYNFVREALNEGKELFHVDLQVGFVHRSLELEAYEWIESTPHIVICTSYWESDVRPATLETFLRGGPMYLEDRNAVLEFKLRFPDLITSIRIACTYPEDDKVYWFPV